MQYLQRQGYPRADPPSVCDRREEGNIEDFLEAIPSTKEGCYFAFSIQWLATINISLILSG